MWIKSALGSIGKAFKKAISETGEIFKKVQKDVSDKISTVVNRIVSSKDTPKGTKSKVEIRGNQITVEIETPDKAIKDDIRKSAEQAEKFEWRMSEHAKQLAEQNTLKSLHEKYVHGGIYRSKKVFERIRYYRSKNLFSHEKFENARAIFGKLWRKRWNKTTFGIMSIKGLNSYLGKTAYEFFSYDELADDYNTLRENYGSHTGEKFQEELDRIAENIINQLNDEIRDKITREVQNIIDEYK